MIYINLIHVKLIKPENGMFNDLIQFKDAKD